jgi:Spy/CpxP family protein refolding chaperone
MKIENDSLLKNDETMKKLIMIATIFSLSFATTFGQRGTQREATTPEQKAEKMTQHLTEQLDLTEAQKDQVYKIHLENAQKRQAEMEARRAEQQAKRTEMQEGMKAQNAQIAAVLTPEQKTKWSELKESNKERGQQMRKGENDRRGPKHGKRGGRGGRGSGPSGNK